MGVFDSPEARNWLRQWLAVFITRKAILPAVKSEAVQLHTAILTLATLAAAVCPRNHGKITDTSKLSCRFHDVFRGEIKRRHKQKPSWKNATTDTWHNDSFSIAKLFMQPSGYDDKTNFDQIDFNGIAAFMFNCGRFPATVESSSDQNEREGLFSHLKKVHLDNIRMSEEQFRRLSQSFINAGGTSLELYWCSIEPEDDEPQLQFEREQQVVSSDCTPDICLRYGTITVEGFMRLIDYGTRCGQSVSCTLNFITLKSNHAVEQPALPMLVTQPISADYTTQLKLSFLKMSTEQICHIIGRMNQLNHSVTLTFSWCTVISDEYNPLRKRIVLPPNPSQDCTKHIEIKCMNISGILFWYAATSAIQFGYTCGLSLCDILPIEVSNAASFHFPQMAAIHSPTQTAKLRFDTVSIPQDVVERLACQASVSGHLVEFVLDKCYVEPHLDCWSLKEKMEEDPAIQIEKFKFEPNNDERHWRWPESYKADQTWDIRFKAKAKESALTESTAEKPEVTDARKEGRRNP